MKRGHYILIFSVVFAMALAVWFAPHSSFLTFMLERRYPGIVPASSYAWALKSSNQDTVMRGLYYLKKRENPVGVPQAIELLKSRDDYVWANAAGYLGMCGRQEAVPYLIKALRHISWRFDPDSVLYLRKLTGMDFGADFNGWQKWWLASHPNDEFNWKSHLGHAPRIPEIE